MSPYAADTSKSNVILILYTNLKSTNHPHIDQLVYPYRIVGCVTLAISEIETFPLLIIPAVRFAL